MSLAFVGSTNGTGFGLACIGAVGPFYRMAGSAALALGACLGGNGTLVGASANVVISQIAKRNKQAFTFWEFTKIGFPLMILSLVICTGYIYLRYFAFNG